MSLKRCASLTMVTEVAEYQKCSLPELYVSIENFNKESKKSNLLKTQGISLREAQKLLTENLTAISLIHETEAKKGDSQPVFTCTILKKEDTKKEVTPKSMNEVLYHSLLIKSIEPVEKLSRSWKRLVQQNIHPPVHTFPYEIIIDKPSSEPEYTIREIRERDKILGRFGLSTHALQMVIESKPARYVIIEPEKQFFDLRDLESKYFTGIVKLKRNFRDTSMEVKYDTEKRFVKSQNLPPIFPPLLTFRL
ncbi:uncharacterized protein [Dipodomys merriami]|uniref:uncharacterized protein n=1 Tax=Dipodomys merriami TaxID=94247 RepID=UPI0038558C42